MAQPTLHGLFVWQELLADDTQAAQDFYGRVVGWQAEPWKESGYFTLTAADVPVAGLMRLPDQFRSTGTKPHWLPYIGAADTDATVVQAQRLGARILKPPAAIEEVGRFAVLADPQGAVFGVFTPLRSGGGRRGKPQAGEFAWFELATSDAQAAFDFYSELFGWEIRRRHDMGAAGTYDIYGLGDADHGVGLGGIYTLHDANQGRTPYWLSYVAVADADATAAAVSAAGGSVVHGPADVPEGSRIAQLVDPQGVLFAVVAAPGTAAKKSAGRKSAAKQPAAKPPVAVQSATRGKAAAGRPGAVQKKAASKKTAAKKTAPKKAALKQAAPKKSAGRKSAVRKKATRSQSAGGGTRLARGKRGKTARGRAAAAKQRTGRPQAAVRGRAAKSAGGRKSAVRRKSPARPARAKAKKKSNRSLRRR